MTPKEQTIQLLQNNRYTTYDNDSYITIYHPPNTHYYLYIHENHLTTHTRHLRETSTNPTTHIPYTDPNYEQKLLQAIQ